MQFFIRLILTSCLACFVASTPPLQAKCKQRSLTADYVVVGVGTAGAVMAKKLSDDKHTSVIALHRGENLSSDPLIALSKNSLFTVLASLLETPLYVNGESTPQPFVDNRELLWAMATPEGGASSINAGAFVRGTDQLYAQWEAVAGPEWSVSRILTEFKRLETYIGQTTNPAFRGEHGPVTVRQIPNPSTVSQKFTQAEIFATGFPFVLDYNDPTTPIGVSSQFQYTQKGKEGQFRVSSATAFLNKKVVTPEGHGVHGRKLRILFNAIGLRTIWKDNKAVGVEYAQNGVQKKVYAKKGVIVSSGLFSSPFLLHSGVGPKPLLDSLGIPVVFDNPNVGQGLADQIGVPIVFSSNPADTPDTFNGLFAQIALLPAPGGDPSIRQIRMAITNPIPGFTAMLVDLLQPKSRGSITINSADPLADPVIDMGTFSNADDLQLYIDAFQTYVKATNIALNNLDATYELIFPDPAILDDTNALTDYIKTFVFSNQSFQSHCRMAPLEQGGVVDGAGRVHGVENLLVVDNSIVPIPMDGATMASAYLIAENIARLILNH